jgi:PAS domain S-box-containing protein
VQPSPERSGGQADALDRLARLQALTASLSQAVTSEQVADAILSQAAAVLGASAGVVARLSEDGSELVCLHATGYPAEVVQSLNRLPAVARLPLPDAVRDRQPVLLANRAERDARYPDVARQTGVRAEGAVAALPLVVRGEAVGGIGLRFPTPRTFTEQDRAFLLTVAGLCAQALERARLFDTERAARERFARFMQHLPGLAWIKDTQGRYVYANDAAERAFRTPREKLYGRTDEEVFPPATAVQFRENDRKALAGAAGVRVVETLRHEDGVVHHSLVSKFPIPGPDGEAALVGGMAIDITEEMRTREALDRERELLGTIIDRIPVMLTLYDPDTKVLRLNPAFEQATGWSARDAAGVSLMEECYPDPAYRGQVAEFMHSCRDGWMDIRMRTRDGRDLETSWANIRLSDGTRVGIGLDISDRKRYEESLKDAGRRKDEFLATLAHELRNPLAPLRNGLEVMKRAAGNPEAVEKARAMMERQLAQMVRLIDDLLDVSRITRGKLELRRQRVDLAAVVQSAVEASRPLVEAAAHRLTVALPPEPVPLDADPVRLAQVFANLLTNAAKYTDRGGAIRLTAERRGDEVVVAVADSGIGIAAEHLPRLFEMFAQVHTALERSQGGLGIGLSLVKGLVEMHGGRVEARSDGPGRGSEFLVRLPLQSPSSLVPCPLPPGTRDKGRGTRRVLVADDNRDAADSLALMLRLAGHEVHTAHDGQEAVEAAAWFRPEVALLDIGMPRLNGYDACRRIREQPGGRQIVLAALTGWGQEEDKRRASEAGFDCHLTKPVDPADLDKILAGLAPPGEPH